MSMPRRSIHPRKEKAAYTYLELRKKLWEPGVSKEVRSKDGEPGFMLTCPCHEDTNASCHITRRHNSGRPGEADWNVRCYACQDDRNFLGKFLRWLDGGHIDRVRIAKAHPDRPITRRVDFAEPIATYFYWTVEGRDRDDALGLKKVRYRVVDADGSTVDKTFIWYHQDPAGRFDGWETKVPAGVMPDVYEYVPADWGLVREVYLCEGEKDADRLSDVLFDTDPATHARAVSLPAGAKTAWIPAYVDPFRDRVVHLCFDRDDAGDAGARLAVKALSDVAASMDQRRAAVGNDLSDHFDAGLGLEDLITSPVETLSRDTVPPDDEELDVGDDDLLDAVVIERVARDLLRGRFCWSGADKWRRYQDGRWRQVDEAVVMNAIRRYFRQWRLREDADGATGQRLAALSRLLRTAFIANQVKLAKGLVAVDAATDFDRHPHLLNVKNGVVDLRTGDLLPHDPALMLTRIAACKYVPGAAHSDWDKALSALPEDTREWMRLRFGQAATGEPPTDDIMPVLHGGGRNGKSGIVSAILYALGDHATVVPDRLLLANPSDHPTELTTLKGARFALAEEAPETRRLDVKRLKTCLGTEAITARRINADNMTFAPTHSLMLTTNYRLQIDENDDGTWRRLALVVFPYRYVDNPTRPNERLVDQTLRLRLRQGKDGQHEAVLAWIVSGARDYYAAGQRLSSPPPSVQADTTAWRRETDAIDGFIAETLVFDPGAKALTSEVFAAFADYLTHRGKATWNEQTFAARFRAHDAAEAAGIRKQRTANLRGLSRRRGIAKAATGQQMCWIGVRFRTAQDDEPASEAA